jgi:hypothetical protein
MDLMCDMDLKALDIEQKNLRMRYIVVQII